MRALPKLAYVQREKDPDNEYLIAWDKLDDTNDGVVGVYELVEELEKRQATEVRRKGTKTWTKPSR